jgi:hypothetical protein
MENQLVNVIELQERGVTATSFSGFEQPIKDFRIGSFLYKLLYTNILNED